MSFNSLCRQTITIEVASSTRDKQGRLSMGAAVTEKVRFQPTTKTIVTKDHEKTPINGIVFAKANSVIAIDARVIYDGTAYRVLTLEKVPGKNGSIHHYEAMVQLWSFA